MAETVGKLKRGALAHYLDSTFGGEAPNWSIIGADVEDMSIELNPNLETKTNILDETAVDDNGYEPSTEVDTYYANPNDGEFYEKLKDIAMNRQTGEACRTTILEVLIDKTAAPFDAWTEDVIIKPQSYGGATGGVRIPYSITFCGNRKQGTVTITDRVPVFTETAAE
ncbi:MAG: hypothetical protein IJX77_10305 [Ruminococcus sp.]|nr:hypothetical protein [Ruminococcus sp.]